VPQITLRRRASVAEGTLAFYFDKPAGFSYEAGQNAFFSLVDPPEDDASGPSRPFTFASAPHESELMIATRMRDSAFKRILGSAPPGTRVEMEGPAGVMVLHEDASRPAVFLAGGIGITPFRSIALDAAQRKLPHPMLLFYSNRRPEDAAFLAELEALQAHNRNFRLIPTMTAAQSGRLSRELLARHLPDPRAPVYYFAGPPGMAMAMQSMLRDLGVSEADMRSEEFYGY
jgi:ferredoxin-NADP reductase